MKKCSNAPLSNVSGLVLAATLLLASCGGGGGDGVVDSSGGGNSTSPPSDFATLSQAAQPTQPAAAGPYQSVLADCVLNTQRADSCTLGTLPLLGQTVTRPVTVDDVMQRVITSKPWMAQRLQQALQAMPPSLLQLFKPVTAVVITGSVRPSFYWGKTGAIYLDPKDLWVTAAERADIDVTPDYRSGYGDKLRVVTAGRYMLGNNYAYGWYDPAATEDRPASEIVLPLAELLAHELTHAADYTPPALIAGLDRTRPLDAVLVDLYDQRISTRLISSSPLRSSLWAGLADVMYSGVPATFGQQQLTAALISPSFAADRATDSYSYVTQYEDTAMLAEEALMALWFGVRRDVAIMDKPFVLNPTATDYLVTWGERGRVAEPRVKAAAEFVLNNVLPGENWAARLAQLPAPVSMVSGASWRANQFLEANLQNRLTTQSVLPDRPMSADLRRVD